jgi:hypothetical protein
MAVIAADKLATYSALLIVATSFPILLVIAFLIAPSIVASLASFTATDLGFLVLLVVRCIELDSMDQFFAVFHVRDDRVKYIVVIALLLTEFFSFCRYWHFDVLTQFGGYLPHQGVIGVSGFWLMD